MAKVPDDLWLLESFLDSVDVESGKDDLDSVARFRRWLTDHHRAAARSVTADDLELARSLRDAMRSALAAHEPGVGMHRAEVAALNRLSGHVGLAVRFDADGTPTLSPAERGVQGVLGEVLAAAIVAAVDGTWNRLRLCANDECAVVFHDHSRNASRRWCDMGVCGNRMKLRAYRARHGAAR